MLTIAQISDLHITAGEPASNTTRLRTALKSIHALKPRPAAILVTGDLADHGAGEEYAALIEILAACEIPLHFGLGNHDLRRPFQDAFPKAPRDENGFVQYAVSIGDLRVIMCDTLEEGENGGGFCSRRADWLARTLAEAPGTPTILALHHPPIASGIAWMDEPADAPWIARLADVIRDQRQILTLACGHMHRAYHGLFARQLVSVSPATALQLTLDFTPLTARAPDWKETLYDEPPGFSLFAWDKQALAIHACVAGEFAPAATFRVPATGG